MGCKKCQQTEVGACTRCGGFFCANHGGRAPIYDKSLCVDCFETRRGTSCAVGVLPTVCLAAFGVYCAVLGNPIPIIAAGILIAFLIYLMTRKFP
jgi:hypothetical protein